MGCRGGGGGDGQGHLQCLTGSKVSSGMLITCGPYPWLWDGQIWNSTISYYIESVLKSLFCVTWVSVVSLLAADPSSNSSTHRALTEDCKLVVTCKMQNRNATDKLNQQCS